ncbi:MAG: CBS domain-containing protein [Deltaproteobacteria bacterium]|nr:CBS domain-containing protein [Deltaproteobacteria bacterium]
MRIHDLMNRDVISCSPQMHLDEAVALMHGKDCGFVAVVEGDVVVGVLTDRDVAISAWQRGVPIAQVQVLEAMTVEPVVVSDEETVERAEELMCAAGVRRLPVVDTARRLLGVVSLGDLAAAPGRGARGSHRDDVVATLSILARRAR